MDYEALKIELSDPRYSRMSSAEIVAALLSQTIAGLAPVPSKKVAKYLDIKGKLPRIQMYSRASVPVDIEQSNPQAAGMVQAAIGLQNAITFYDDFDLSDPEVKKVATDRLNSIMQTGLISADDVTAIIEMGTVRVPRWPGVTERDVWIARGQP